MAKAVFLGLPVHGHTNPTLPLVQELVARGERIVYCSIEEFRPRIEATGAVFRSYGDLHGLDISRTAGSLFRTAAALLTVTERRLPALIGQLRAEAPDYLIHDSMCAWGKYAARITGLPAVCTVTTFAFGAGSPTRSPMFRRRIVRLLAGGFADVLGYLRIARRLQRTYGIRGAGLWDAFANREPLNLVFTSRDFQPGGDTFDPSYRFVGPSLAPRGDGAGFSVGAREGQRVIYVSMGTIVARQEPFFRGCFEAFGGGAHRVVLSTGRSADISALGPIPANFLVRSHVPQLEVLERADLFITHGGMNSVHEGLCSGVPMIVIPRTAEQGLVAERVVAVGAGILLEARKATPDRLSAAAAAVLAEPGYRSSSRRIGESLRAAGGHVRAADEILAHLSALGRRA